jgi:antitoxin (DNA-binding transcriptional repressor) of toxin-antitoxin stability system
MYIVRMKRVTASEARRNWFRLLDEVIDGEVVAITRKGKRIVIRREDRARSARQKLPDYADILRVPDVDRADSWRWEWRGPEEEIELRAESAP